MPDFVSWASATDVFTLPHLLPVPLGITYVVVPTNPPYHANVGAGERNTASIGVGERFTVNIGRQG